MINLNLAIFKYQVANIMEGRAFDFSILRLIDIQPNVAHALVINTFQIGCAMTLPSAVFCNAIKLSSAGSK